MMETPCYGAQSIVNPLQQKGDILSVLRYTRSLKPKPYHWQSPGDQTSDSHTARFRNVICNRIETIEKRCNENGISKLFQG